MPILTPLPNITMHVVQPKEFSFCCRLYVAFVKASS